MDDEWTIPGLDGRRAFLKRGGAAMAAATAYGLYPEMGLAADVPRQFDGSKFQLKAVESKTWWRAPDRLFIAPAPF